ncbi:MAG: DCC1-like thiol-disulfide oxidoreductase family protein [Actinomycetota bacterium]
MLLIFDGDCGFCTSSAGWIERRLPDDVRVAPWQILELDEYGLTEDDVTTAAYWVDEAGTNYRGHLGIGKSLIAAGGIWTVPGHLIVRPPVSWLAKPIYGWIAKNRHLMPGASEACRVDLSGSAGGAEARSRD